MPLPQTSKFQRYGNGLKYAVGQDISLAASASTTFDVQVPTWACYLTVVRFEQVKNRLTVNDKNRNIVIFQNISLYRDYRNELIYNAPIYPGGLLNVTVVNADAVNANTNNISFEFSNYLTLKELDDLNRDK